MQFTRRTLTPLHPSLPLCSPPLFPACRRAHLPSTTSMPSSSSALHPPPSTLLLCQTEHVSRRSWRSRSATDTTTCTSSSRAASLDATEVGSFSTLARWERRIEVCFLHPCGRPVPREESLGCFCAAGMELVKVPSP